MNAASRQGDRHPFRQTTPVAYTNITHQSCTGEQFTFRGIALLEAKSPHARIQIKRIISRERLATPHDLALSIDSPSPSLLPLIPHDRPGALLRLLISPRGARLYRIRPLDTRRNGLAQPPLLLEPLDLCRWVEHIPHGPEAEAPRCVDGAVLVDDDLDVPCAAEQVQPFLGCGLGGVRDGDAGYCAGVAVCDGA